MGDYDNGVGFERDECGCAYTDPVEKALGDQSLASTKATVTAERRSEALARWETMEGPFSAPEPNCQCGRRAGLSTS